MEKKKQFILLYIIFIITKINKPISRLRRTFIEIERYLNCILVQIEVHKFQMLYNIVFLCKHHRQYNYNYYVKLIQPY